MPKKPVKKRRNKTAKKKAKVKKKHIRKRRSVSGSKKRRFA